MNLRNKREIEVMAPVGSFESLEAAFQGGADAVYFGIEQLNMRARSSINFTIEDLQEIVTRCQKHQVKTYLTLNTILYDHDLRLMKTIIDAAKKYKVNAIIAMDHAAIMYAKEIGQTIHISTQVNITNIETVRFYAPFADTMVLSRELTLQQIQKICTQIKEQNVKGPNGQLVKVECFVHGALCMAVSGKCYLSLHSMNSSANRGACKQNCRREYTVADHEGNQFLIDNEYIMSPKDLCTIGFLDKILDAGVSVLKIEGRSKGPDYVKEVTACYKEAVEMWKSDKTPSLESISMWEKRMSRVYNRGFWGGYYLGKKLGEWTATPGSISKTEKIYLGKGKNYFGKIGIAEFQLEKGKLELGDKIMITGPSIGLYEGEVEELRKELEPVSEVSKGDLFSMPVGVKVRPSDKLFKVVERSTND